MVLSSGPEGRRLVALGIGFIEMVIQLKPLLWNLDTKDVALIHVHT